MNSYSRLQEGGLSTRDFNTCQKTLETTAELKGTKKFTEFLECTGRAIDFALKHGIEDECGLIRDALDMIDLYQKVTDRPSKIIQLIVVFAVDTRFTHSFEKAVKVVRKLSLSKRQDTSDELVWQYVCMYDYLTSLEQTWKAYCRYNPIRKNQYETGQLSLKTEISLNLREYIEALRNCESELNNQFETWQEKTVPKGFRRDANNAFNKEIVRELTKDKIQYHEFVQDATAQFRQGDFNINQIEYDSETTEDSLDAHNLLTFNIESKFKRAMRNKWHCFLKLGQTFRGRERI